METYLDEQFGTFVLEHFVWQGSWASSSGQGIRIMVLASVRKPLPPSRKQLDALNEVIAGWPTIIQGTKRLLTEFYREDYPRIVADMESGLIVPFTEEELPDPKGKYRIEDVFDFEDPAIIVPLKLFGKTATRSAILQFDVSYDYEHAIDVLVEQGEPKSVGQSGFFEEE